MMRKSEELKEELSKALSGVSDTLSSAVLDAMKLYFENIESDEWQKYKEEWKTKEFIKFVYESELPDDDKERLRLLRNYSVNKDISMLMELFDEAIERINDLEMRLEAEIDY